MTGSGYEPISKLTAADPCDSFDCGQTPLNEFLQRFAVVNQKSGGAQTYVCRRADEIVGYYSLCVGSVEYETAPGRLSRGLARNPIPVIILARMAVDKLHQGKGIGRALLKDALLRTLQVSDVVGIRALLVHAKDDSARDWYEKWEFESSPTDPYHLFLMIKDLKALVSGGQ